MASTEKALKNLGERIAKLGVNDTTKLSGLELNALHEHGSLEFFKRFEPMRFRILAMATHQRALRVA